MIGQGIHVLILFDLLANQANAVCKAEHAAWLHQRLIPSRNIGALKLKGAAHARRVACAWAGV